MPWVPALLQVQGDTIRASAATDSVHRYAPLDSVVVESPVPDAILPILQAIFNAPTWLQISVVAVLALLGIALLALGWRRRQRIRTWFTTRQRGTRLALIAAVGVMGLAAAGFGVASWNYMQHDNDFCNGCHVMSSAVDRFYLSEHKQLQCHDCHRQSMYASARQLVLWVLEKPEDIPPHAPVPTRVCAECHVREDPDSTWQRITATAGHRVHLESDSSALRDVQCVTCHGLEIHRFVPVDSTCGQSGCHATLDIKLGGMAMQTSLHCSTCHEFTRPVSELTSLDSTARALVPGQSECFSCHEMRAALESFDPEREPHNAVCGTCHNPHEQTRPQQAFESCGAAGCHANAAAETPFHEGVSAARLADCASCHRAHTWSVPDAQCLACHGDIFGAGSRRSAGAGATPAFVARAHRVSGETPILPAMMQQPPGAARAELPPFSHREHRGVGCGACHSSARRHGEVTLGSARDCQSCHHGGEAASGCASCHARSELAGEARVGEAMRLSVWDAPRQRQMAFRHSWHGGVACATCHTGGVEMAVEITCASCHREHHQPNAECRFCHESGKDVHTRAAHLGCAGSGCHSAATQVALSPPTRGVCLTCHQDMVDHRPGRACAACHQVEWVGGPVGR